MRTSPPEMSSSPAIIRSSVDLPQPDGPTKTTNSPSATSRVAPWITSKVPKRLTTFRERDAGHGAYLTAPAAMPAMK